MYEINVERSFNASHAIRLPDDTLEPVHEHDWQVRVTVARFELDEIETVMDFHDLEAAIEQVIGPMRGQHINDLGPFKEEGVNPTAERVAWWIGTRVVEHLPDPVSFVAVTVTEAEGCSATWRP